jgi:lipoprotein-anchoring transpeptidase ErfK/SrfK
VTDRTTDAASDDAADSRDGIHEPDAEADAVEPADGAPETVEEPAAADAEEADGDGADDAVDEADAAQADVDEAEDADADEADAEAAVADEADGADAEAADEADAEAADVDDEVDSAEADAADDLTESSDAELETPDAPAAADETADTSDAAEGDSPEAEAEPAADDEPAGDAEPVEAEDAADEVPTAEDQASVEDEVPAEDTAPVEDEAPVGEPVAAMAATDDTETAIIAPPTTPDAPTVELSPTTVDAPVYAWAPPAPKPPKNRKNRKKMWIGIAASAAAVGLIASSLVLIAPGTSVAGVGVGGLTSGGAAGALQQRLDDTAIVLVGAGGDTVVTGADLGATVDAEKLADEAFGSHPMWNPTKWFSAPIDADVAIDAAAATAALRQAVPDLFVDPVDATLAYDAGSAMYVTTAGKPGEGVDVAEVQAALQEAYDSGQSRVEFEPVMAPVEPATTTETAASTAKTLNGILGTAGFYVGKERTVPVSRAVAASWLSVTHEPDGAFTIAADQAAIQKVVDTLPKAVDRKLVNATVITDTEGGVLREVTKGVSGRTLGDTGDIAASYAAQLAQGNGVYVLPVTEKKFQTTKLARSIEVNISSQTAYLFENGKVVHSYLISSGLYGHDTNLGHFRIYAKVARQDMGDEELIKADYFTPDVPWISYFNGDEALHGAYWHHNFGHRMSHGCVNMPIDAAKLVYDWAPIGTEVWVHT